MVTLVEGRHAGAFILSEADGHRSRENIIIASGSGIVIAGTPCGKVKLGAATAAAKAGGNTGNGTLTMDATTPVRSGAMSGVYTVRLIAAAANAGTFRVENPDGDVIGDVAVGATFDDDIKFATADGSTDFAVGDGFDITVAVGSEKYKPSPATGSDGSENAVALPIYTVDATSADVAVAAITNDAEVNGKVLTYHASVDDDAKRAAKAKQLRAVGIKVR